MFDYFKGFITDKRKTSKGCFVTVEVSGTGYLLEVSETDFQGVNVDEKEIQKMYVFLSHREDLMSLSGFSKNLPAQKELVQSSRRKLFSSLKTSL